MKKINKKHIKESFLKEIDSSILLKSSMQGIKNSVMSDYMRLFNNGVWSTEIESDYFSDYLNHNLTLTFESNIKGDKLHFLLNIGFKLGYEVTVKVLQGCIAIVYVVNSEQLNSVEF